MPNMPTCLSRVGRLALRPEKGARYALTETCSACDLAAVGVGPPNRRWRVRAISGAAYGAPRIAVVS